MHAQVFIMIINIWHAARINLSSEITQREIESEREAFTHIHPHHAKIDRVCCNYVTLEKLS